MIFAVHEQISLFRHKMRAFCVDVSMETLVAAGVGVSGSLFSGKLFL